MNTEIRVGLFVVVGLALLTFFLIRIGEWPFFGDMGKTYEVKALFNNVIGLDVGAQVVLSGVKIGEVKRIGLEGNKALVLMEIDEDVDFPSDSQARLASVGLLGQAILEIIPSGSLGIASARETGEIRSLNPVTLDQLVTVLSGIGKDVTEVTSSIRDFLGVEGGKDRMQRIMINLEKFSTELERVISENQDKVGNTVDLMQTLAQTMQDSIGVNLPTIVDDLKTLSAGLREVVENRKGDMDFSIEKAREVLERLDTAVQTLQSILGKIDSGEGSVGKLINEPDIVDKTQELMGRVETLVADVENFMRKPSQLDYNYGFRTAYYGRSEDFKYHYRLTVNFSKRDSVNFELINDRIRNKPPVLLPGEIPDEGVLQLSDEFTFSATYGRNFKGGKISFGLIESSTGVVFDVGEYNDRLRFSFEGFNFGRDKGPHIRVASHVRLWHGLFITVGYDDPIDKRRGQLFYGGGYRF